MPSSKLQIVVVLFDSRLWWLNLPLGESGSGFVHGGPVLMLSVCISDGYFNCVELQHENMERHGRPVGVVIVFEVRGSFISDTKKEEIRKPETEELKWGLRRVHLGAEIGDEVGAFEGCNGLSVVQLTIVCQKPLSMHNEVEIRFHSSKELAEINEFRRVKLAYDLMVIVESKEVVDYLANEVLLDQLRMYNQSEDIHKRIEEACSNSESSSQASREGYRKLEVPAFEIETTIASQKQQGEIVPTNDTTSVVNRNTLGRPVPSRPWEQQQTYGGLHLGAFKPSCIISITLNDGKTRKQLQDKKTQQPSALPEKDSIQPQVPLRLRLPLISKLFSTAYFDSDLRFLHSVSGSWLLAEPVGFQPSKQPLK
ncbi:hypothetical protein Tco_0886592 [Tanacetum coccineum]